MRMWNLSENKLKIYNSADEFLATEIPLMTFDELFNLVEHNKIQDPTDLKMAEMIIDAESDWIISIYSLNDFLVVLEKEIDGRTTKSNLENLLRKYSKDINKYAWESESVSSLLGIFDLTNETDLRKAFFSLTERIGN